MTMDNEFNEIVDQAINGNQLQIDMLISIMREKSSEKEIVSIFQALKGRVYSLTKKHRVLVMCLLTCKWNVSDQCLELFTNFVLELISVNTLFLKDSIRCLVKEFSLKSDVADEELETLQKKIDGIHHIIESIVQIAPLSVKFVGEAIEAFFPFIGKSLFVLKTYVVNILKVTTYVQDLRHQVLAVIVDKMLSMDVGILRHDIERIMDEQNDMQFQLEQDSIATNDESLLQIDKMDNLMLLFMTYIKDHCYSNGDGDTIQWKRSKALFQELISIFEKVILKAQESSHVQFILFYISGLHKNLSNDFLAACWIMFENPSNSLVTRQGACSYLGSYLARAKIVDKDSIKDQMKRMSEWLHRYLKLQDGSNIQADYHKHGAFYSLSQTFFYVFVYHHKAFIESENGMIFLKSLDLPRIVLSKLNPLRFCLKTIVDVFARITRMYELVFCYSTMEKNNRQRIFSQLDQNDSKLKFMENFFPFDPYILPRSNVFIKPLYNEWNDLSEMTSDEEGEDKEDELLRDDMEGIDDLFASINPHLSMNRLSTSRKSNAHSFEMMCISPGFMNYN